MNIRKDILISILTRLAGIYPDCTDEHTYREYVSEQTSEKIFMGHLLYLAEKGLIETDLRLDIGHRKYQLTPGLLRINCNGLDFLKEQARVL